MRRLLAALVLVATALVPAPAAGDAGAYTFPGNAGLTHPFGAPVAAETEPIDFRTSHDFTQLTVEPHDWAGGDVWIKVCLRFGSACIRTVEGDGPLVIDAPPGQPYSKNVVARVYVYTAHAWADGDVSAATWGGVRVQFNPEPVLYDIVPYAAAGYGGVAPMGIPINVRFQCGPYVGAWCMTAPVTARNVRISVVDHVADRTYFEACLYYPNGATIQCSPATNLAQMPGIPAGGKVDVRPYAALGSELVGTGGYVLVQYVL